MRRQMQSLRLGVFVLAAVAGSLAMASPALLVVGHGSPSPHWNNQFTAFVQSVRDAARKAGLEMPVAGAFLEVAQPRVLDVAERMHRAGYDPVIVAPAFVVPTGHNVVDLPMVLGVRFCAHHARDLQQEGATLQRASGRLVLLDPIVGWGDALGEVLADRAMRLSHKASEEAVLVLIHGSPKFSSWIRAGLAEHVTPIIKKAGFDAVGYAFVGMGQMMAGLSGHGADLPREELNGLGKGHGAVIVVAAYVATTPRELFSDWPQKTASGAAVRVSDQALLPHPALARDLVNTAAQASRVLGLE